jgi:hypothetical protein
LIGDDVYKDRHVYIQQRAALYSLNGLMFAIVASFVIDLVRVAPEVPTPGSPH